MMLSLDVAINATSGAIFDRDAAPNGLRVVTDTRTLAVGDTFLALRGERFDGHAYIGEAIARGARLAIIDDPAVRVAGTATLVVEDTLRAYMALARAARDQFRGTVIGITGSAGKTTTKVFTTQLLAQRYGHRVIAAPANENNEIGVSKLLLAATNEAHDAIVVEMGARHYGDVATLVAVAKPQVGILTNIGEAHVEIMGSRERLEETKWGLFSGGARAVLNARDHASTTRASSLPERPHWFFAGAAGEDFPANGRVTALLGTGQLVDVDGECTRTHAVEVHVPGAHNRANLAAAIAGAMELDVAIEQIVAAIPTLRLPEGRFEPITLPSGTRLIYDAYNANASGMVAALDAFCEEAGTRHIAVLGSMAELGEEAPALHEQVGAHAAARKVDVLLVGGEYARELSEGAARAGLSSERIVPFATNSQAAAWLRRHLREGDVVLLKGSRKYKLEEIVEELRA